MRTQRFVMAMVMLSLVCFSAATQAANYSWNTGSGDWFTAGNWTPAGGPPDSVGADTAFIGNGGTATISSGAADPAGIQIGTATAPSGSGTLNITGGSLTTSSLYVKTNAGFGGTVTQSSGAVTINSLLYVTNSGATGAGTGVYNLNGGTMTFAAGATLKLYHDGTFNHNNGAALTVGNNVEVGIGSGGTSIYNLNGNTLNTGYMTLAMGGGIGADQVNLGTGAINTNDYFQVGGTTDAPTTLTLGTGSSLTTGVIAGGLDNFYAGSMGGTAQSIVNVSGGALSIRGSLLMATAGGNHIFNLNSNTLTFTGATSELDLQQGGTFNVNYGAGTMTVPGAVRVGSTANGSSIFNLNGSTLTTGYATVGLGGGTEVDQFNLGGGTLNTNDYFQVGGTTGTPTVFTLNTGDTLTTGFVAGANDNFYAGAVGGTAQSITNISGGALSVRGSFLVATSGGTHTVNLNSNTLTFTGASSELDLQQGGTFNVNFASGTLSVPVAVRVGSTANGSSIFNLNGRTLSTGYATIGLGGGAGVDQFNLGGGTVNVNDYFQVGGTTGTPTVFNLNTGDTLTTGFIAGGNDAFYAGAVGGAAQSITNISGGALNVRGNLIVATSGGTHTVNLNTNTLTFTGAGSQIDMAQGGTLNVNFASGTLAVPGAVLVGSTSTGSSIFNLNGNTLNTVYTTVGLGGGAGADQFNFGNGTVNVSDYFQVGGTTDAATVVTMGAGSALNVGTVAGGLDNLYIGHIGGTAKATFNVNGGAINVRGQMLLAPHGSTGGTHQFNLNSGSLTFVAGAGDRITIQREAVFAVNGGTVTNPGNFLIGEQGVGASQYVQTGGTVSVDGNVRVALAAGADDTITMSGGTLTLTSATSDLSLERNGIVNISGGALNVGRNFLVGMTNGITSTVNQSGGTVTTTGDFRLGTTSGATGALNLTGGTLVVNGNFQPGYVAGGVGTVLVDGGSLRVNGTLNLNTAGSKTFVFDGGKLSAVTMQNVGGIMNYTGGLLSPGLLGNVQTMTINGGLTMPMAGGIEFDLAQKEVFGGVNDRIIINGNLTLAGILSVNELPGFTAGLYPVMSFTGTFTDLGAVTDKPGYLSIFVQLNAGGVGGMVYLFAVPEPSSGLLLGLGALALVRRRRQK